MSERTQRAGARVVGREPELETVLEHVCADHPSGALLLTGLAGIGKTTLWEAGLEAAAERGTRVLSARPSAAEARLRFAGLTDILHDAPGEALDPLPDPKREALEVALLRVRRRDVRHEPRAVWLGLLDVLRRLGRVRREGRRAPRARGGGRPSTQAGRAS